MASLTKLLQATKAHDSIFASVPLANHLHRLTIDAVHSILFVMYLEETAVPRRDEDILEKLLALNLERASGYAGDQEGKISPAK